jgi:hypothetical protein
VEGDHFNVSLSAVATIGLGVGKTMTFGGWVVGAVVQGPQIELINQSLNYNKECGEKAELSLDMMKAFDLKLSGTYGNGIAGTIYGGARFWGGFRVNFKDNNYSAYFVNGNQVKLTATLHAGLASTTWTLADSGVTEAQSLILQGSF